MNKVGAKKFLITIWVLLTTLIFSYFGLLISNFALNDKNINNNVAAADLTISSYDQLKSFADSVNSGNTYSGKTVVLGESIDCSAKELHSIGGGSFDRYLNSGTQNKFEGTFDGQGNSISNFTIVSGYYETNRVINDKNDRRYYHYYYNGLFGYLGSSGKVKNVKISNYDIEVSQDHSGPGGTNTNYNYNNVLVAYADSGANVDCCWIAGGMGTVHSGATKKNLMLTSSIINASGTEITEAHTTTGLSYSSVGGNYNSLASDGTQTIWYYASDYNYGWPYLRVFIQNWTELTFTPNDASLGMVSPSSIQIPTDYGLDRYHSTANPTGFLDQVVTATANPGSRFVRWSPIEWETEQIIFRVDFEREPYQIRFYPCEGVKPTGCTDDYLEITVTYEEEIEMTETWTAQGTTLTYRIGDDTVTYVFENIYRKVSFGEYSVWSDSTNYEVFHIEDDGNDWSKVPNIQELFGSTTFSLNPTIELKTYETQWGN